MRDLITQLRAQLALHEHWAATYRQLLELMESDGHPPLTVDRSTEHR